MRLPDGKAWLKKRQEEQLVGADQGMTVPVLGLRVRLSRACEGQVKPSYTRLN